MNPSQQVAVDHDLGPLLVLAGAGSGKTRVVTHRIARLLERGVAARNILAVTFTNKAAGEMMDRVRTLVGPKRGKALSVSTFHRFGLDVLGSETRALGLRGRSFAIFDQADSSGVLREELRNIRGDRNYDIGAILSRISARKNDFVEPDAGAIPSDDGDPYGEITAMVYPRYIEAMRAFQAFDFDDLICEVVRLWRRRPDVLDKWRKRFRYVIVDEYQDTNHAQLELVRLLGGEHRNVCVVGDDDQSIYAWRGADVQNILDFEAHFPGAKVVKLEHNYRSKKAILDLADVVLKKTTTRRHEKSIIAVREGGEKVQSVIADDPEVEATFVANEAARLIETGEMRPKDIAVLYRSNLQSAELEAALKERQLPFRMIGGTQFYERKEVKDLVAYLRVALDPRDELSLRRIVNYPSRGIGPAALQRLTQTATARDKSLWAVIAQPHLVSDLNAASRDGCKDLWTIIENTRERLARRETSAEVARGVCDDIDLKKDIQQGSTSNAAAARRWGNVEGLINVFKRRDERGQGGRDALAEFLRLLALREDQEEEKTTDRITLTTMHGAKGLEFKTVFIVGLEEGLLPHSRTQTERATDMPTTKDGSESIEEERRLFYVAVTRAMDRLYLCRSKRRGMRGKQVARTPSRFLSELPEELLEEREEGEASAPDLGEQAAGAASVLAAINFDAKAPVIRRPGT